MLLWVAYGLFVLVLCAAAIVGVTFVSVRMMRGLVLERVELAPPTEETWARSHAFRFIGSFEVRMSIIRSKVFSWRHETSPTFFCVYLVGDDNRDFDFVTEFENDVSLTTGSGAGGQMFSRPPTSYLETLPGRSLFDLWAAHEDSIAFLEQLGGAVVRREAPPFVESFVKACRQQMEFVSQIPFYPLRGLYWFLIRKWRFKNVSIRRQSERGWIRLPRELSGWPAGGDRLQ